MIKKLEQVIMKLEEDMKDSYLEWIGKWADYIRKVSNIEYDKFPRYKRGDVLLIDFGKNLGTQFSGQHYALVIREVDKRDGNITIIPLTSKKENNYENNYNEKYNLDIGKVLNNKKDTIAKINQITTLSKIKIIRKFPVAKIRDNYTMDLIDAKIKKIYLKAIDKNE